jgi:ATP-dependent protease HslVU (ClpYQ) peptidase subunit
LSLLREQLQEMKAKVAERTTEEFRRITAEEVQKLIESKTIEGLAVGTTAPDFSLPDATGKKVSLSETLQQGPVVLTFYRGSW